MAGTNAFAFCRCRSICTGGGGSESGRKKVEECLLAGTGTKSTFQSLRKLEKAVAVFGVCSGVLRGKLRESPGKIAGKIFPSRDMLQILGFRAPGKANLPGTLGRHCRGLVPTFRAGCFLKSTVPRERKMRTKFFCTNFLNTPQVSGTSRQNSRDIPDSSLRNPRKTNFSRAGTKFSAKTPTPPGGLRTQKVYLCALFSCLSSSLLEFFWITSLPIIALFLVWTNGAIFTGPH